MGWSFSKDSAHKGHPQTALGVPKVGRKHREKPGGHPWKAKSPSLPAQGVGACAPAAFQLPRPRFTQIVSRVGGDFADYNHNLRSLSLSLEREKKPKTNSCDQAAAACLVWAAPAAKMPLGHGFPQGFGVVWGPKLCDL